MSSFDSANINNLASVHSFTCLLGLKWSQICVLLVIGYCITCSLQNVQGASPSITRQEIADAPNDYTDNDGRLLSFSNFYRYSNDCELGELDTPLDIEAVSYRSTGNFLNTTLWLKEYVNKSEDELDERDLRFYVYAVNLTDKSMNPQEFSGSLIRILNQTSGPIQLLESVPIVISDMPAQKVFYNTLDNLVEGNALSKTMMVIIIKGNVSYILEYTAVPQLFPIFLPDIKQMTDSVELFRHDDDQLPIFEQEAVNLQYPTNWDLYRYGTDKTVTLSSAMEPIVTFSPRSEGNLDVSLEVNVLDNFDAQPPDDVEEIARSTLEAGAVINEFKSDINANDNNSSRTILMKVTKDNISHEVMQKYYRIEDEILIMNYEAPRAKFDNFLPIVQKIMNSLEYDNNRTKSLHTFESRNYGGIRILYPFNWYLLDFQDAEDEFENNYSVISIFTPKRGYLLNSIGATGISEDSDWLVTYSVYIDIFSTYDRGVDYVYTISSDNGGTNWTEVLSEVTADGKFRDIVSPVKLNYSVINEIQYSYDSKYINLDLDLSKLGFPAEFNILFSTLGYNASPDNDAILCVFGDITNFFSIPPPVFTLSPVSNEPLNFEQNEKRQLEIQVKGQGQSDAKVFLFANETSGMEIKFSPNPISMTGSETAISLIEIDTKNALPRTHTLPLYANISFPTSVSLVFRGGEGKTAVINPQVNNITKNANLTITVDEPLSPQQQMKGWLEDWFNPLTGTWTTITTIATGVLGWRIWVRKRDNPNNRAQYDKKNSGANSL